MVEAVERRARAHANDLEGLKLYYGGGFGSAPEVEFRKSLEIDPLDYNAQYYLAEVLLARGRMLTRWEEHEEAVEMLEEARGYAPHRKDIALALGDAYFEWGRPEQARAVYGQYLKMGGTAERARKRA